MSLILRDYQNTLKGGVYDKWRAGYRNALAVLPTGGGKSATTATIFKEVNTTSCLMAHRGELVSQLSEALASVGLYHRIIASDATIKFCIAQHIEKFGRSFFAPQSPFGVVSVQTLVKRADDLKQWLHSVKLWAVDEAHHVLQDNIWGKATALFTNDDVFGLGVTATPVRCDRKSLHRSRSGVFDAMVEGPSMRDLIEWGFLSDYKFYAPKPSYEMDESDLSDSTGEWKPDAVRKKAHASKITGDIVESYLRFAPGKLGITFMPDIELAMQTAKDFQAAGVPAQCVSGKTPDAIRADFMRQFRARKILQLINVDLFDEGLDVPGVEVVSMGRPTMSLGKYRQQAGRQTRPVYAQGFDLNTVDGRLAAIAAGPKPYGIIIDHVNNHVPHKLPDTHRVWNIALEEKGKKSKQADDAIPMIACTNAECAQLYEAVTKKCPHCGHVKEPASRSSPEFVDGDIIEYSPELLAMMRGEIARIDGDAQIPLGASPIVENSIKKRWRERQEAQQELRKTIALWAGVGRDIHKRDDSEMYRRFWFTFDTDVMSAMALGTSEARELNERIAADAARQMELAA